MENSLSIFHQHLIKPKYTKDLAGVTTDNKMLKPNKETNMSEKKKAKFDENVKVNWDEVRNDILNSDSWVSWDDMHLLGYTVEDQRLADSYGLCSNDIRKEHKKTGEKVNLKELAKKQIDLEIAKLVKRKENLDNTNESELLKIETTSEKPIKMVGMSEEIPTYATAQYRKAMFGEYPAIFQAPAGATAPPGYHVVRSKSGKTFFRKNRGNKGGAPTPYVPKQKATKQKATKQKATKQKATKQKATKQKAAKPIKESVPDVKNMGMVDAYKTLDAYAKKYGIKVPKKEQANRGRYIDYLNSKKKARAKLVAQKAAKPKGARMRRTKEQIAEKTRQQEQQVKAINEAIQKRGGKIISEDDLKEIFSSK
jgi:hypothetical protein